MARDVAECLILNRRNELLLQKKTLDYPITHGCWGLFGGIIRDGERPEDTIRRELIEETGQSINPEYYTVSEYSVGDVHGTSTIFVARVNWKPVQIALKEGAGFAFVDKSEIGDFKINEFDLGVIRKYFENG